MHSFVSIIVPVHGSRDLTETLNSIVLQTYKLYECLVIVDGSTVSSISSYRSLVDSLDSRFSLYSYKFNHGASYARRYGVLRSTGSILAFLDSDDIWSPFYLSTIVPLHQEYSDFPMVSTSISLNLEKILFPAPVCPKFISLSSLCFQHHFSTPATSIKRHMLNQNFSLHLRYAEDLHFFLTNLFYSNKSLIYIEQPLVFCTRAQASPGGLSAHRVPMYLSASFVYTTIIYRFCCIHPFASLILLFRSLYSLMRSFQFSILSLFLYVF